MDESRTHSIPADIVRGFVRLYQLLTVGVPHRCRFAPSCSTYMSEALATYGLLKGLFFGIRRILNCHPWHAGGYDPV